MRRFRDGSRGELMLAYLVYAVMFLGSLFVVARYGIGRAFAYVYVPFLLFLPNVPEVQRPPLPVLGPPAALGAGVLLALLFRGSELRKIRWNIIDTAVFLMLIPIFLSSNNSDGPVRGIRDMIDYSFQWVVPYFMGRIALTDADGRRRLLQVLCISTVIIGIGAAYEARISPNATGRITKMLGLNHSASGVVFGRWGLMRAMVTLPQPIDLGNCGVLCGGLILVLVSATGTRWKSPLVLAGLVGAGAMVVGSISMTSLGAMGVAFVLYFLFSRPGIGPKLVVPYLAVFFLAITFYTAHALTIELPDERPDSDLDPVGSSHWIRVRIIQDAWPKCQDAGPFGFGHDLTTNDIGSNSVDNAYLLFIISQGWVSLAFWIVYAFVIAFKGAAALRRATTDSERLPVAAAIAGIFAIFYAMYTVFFGFVFANLMCVMCGFLATMTQMLAAPRPRALPSAYQQPLPLGAPPVGGYR